VDRGTATIVVGGQFNAAELPRANSLIYDVRNSGERRANRRQARPSDAAIAPHFMASLTASLRIWIVYTVTLGARALSLVAASGLHSLRVVIARLLRVVTQ
jgi:hypothetical protein